MSQHLEHEIIVDENGKAVVKNNNKDGPGKITKLNPGDTVTFKSNAADTEIRYKEHQGTPDPPVKKGSPFANLPPGRRHKVSDGTTFTVQTECTFEDHFVFDCGHTVSGIFSEWGSLTGRPRGGNTPGPND